MEKGGRFHQTFVLEIVLSDKPVELFITLYITTDDLILSWFKGTG